MNQKHEIMKRIFDNCDLMFHGQTINRELILKNLASFLNDTSDNEEHNVGIILHTGSILYDVITIVYAAMSNILLNETDGKDVVSKLEPGDSVLYGINKKQRYRFEGIETITDRATGKEEKRVILRQPDKNDRNATRLPEILWRNIQPYQGSAVRYGGIGIKNIGPIREDFFVNVLGFKIDEIPSYIDTSTIIVMAKDKASDILNNTVLSFDGKTAKLLEIITASYFTENDELPFGGNIGKNEPILKICGNVSVARQKITEISENKNIGLIISGNDQIAKGITEIPMLMKRKTLKYVFLALHIDSEDIPFLLEQYDNSILFACTKDFLLSNSLVNNNKGALIDELNRQIDAVIDRSVQPIVLQGEFGWEDYKRFKRGILAIRYSEIDPELKDEFIMNAYSVMKIFVTAIFDISIMEKMVDEGKINAFSPSQRLQELREALSRFPLYLKDTASSILAMLEDAYLYYYEGTLKEKYVKEFLTENSDGKIAIIVPKAYYAQIAEEDGLYDLMKKPSYLTITTANRFDNNRVYDGIICVGDLSGTRFDTFRCRSSKDIIPLLYSFESNLFKLKMKKANELEKYYNSHTSAAFVNETEYTDVLYDDDATEYDVEETAKEDNEIDEYIKTLNDQSIFRSFGESSGQSPMANIAAVGVFESGHKIFFSQMYKAYVLNEETGEVSEKEVGDLKEGDTLIFTQNNEQTKDIIDDILQKLISEHKLTSDLIECYYMSKRWKEALIEYKTENHLRTKKIAEEMIKNGVPVQEMTIRGWLDEDSHTVGPRKAESIEQIALLVEDHDMFERYKEYYDACGKIRKLRVEILKMLGRAIIQKVSGKGLEKNMLFAEISNKITSLSLVLKLEVLTIPDHTKQVPANVTNRPFILKE